MQTLTLRILQGADRGRVYTELRTPITIGREDGNSIQLNDERASRYHVKVQENNGEILLADLESTNGTRVNGMDCQIRNLRYGDLISIGRTVLLYGTREEIASRIESGSNSNDFRTADQLQDCESEEIDPDLSTGIAGSYRELVLKLNEPSLPTNLQPSQAATLSELLEFMHSQIGTIIDNSRYMEDADPPKIVCDLGTWQILVQMHAGLAGFIRRVGDPTLDNSSNDFDTGEND
jgi:pSer/pThr/pTyr-binding forkhead associated (FHA) protein